MKSSTASTNYAIRDIDLEECHKLFTNNKIKETHFNDNQLSERKSVIVESKISSGVTRDKWGREIEFLLSCIALSVGLGNVWRFPFIALENGGGAFIIPYIIVLLLIGRPVYYMEVIIGQFSSRSCIKVFDFAPIMRGVGYGQVYSTALATTYYSSIMGLTIRYLIASFSKTLPWTVCKDQWNTSNCIDSSATPLQYVTDSNSNITKKTSTELYFLTEVLREKDNINDGIGVPSLDLVGCLALAWILIAIILIKGIRSSGKASYFLAIFPYLVMLVLLFRAITLPGAINGIIYFLKPNWSQLLTPKVWYAAITQVFFSLAICFGTLIMYASYNQFSRNVHRDVILITTVDSFTSLLAGCIIFGILGNLAYQTKTNDINSVVKGGAGLAFISYPDAIAKLDVVPQLFAILFFLMLLVLGIGSNIGMASSVITVLKDQFNIIPHWVLAIIVSIIGFLIGLIYTTPGGQFVLNLVDFFGASFIALVLAIAELIAIGWIYGVKRFCRDIEFMFGTKTGIYWRICWAIITPALMIIVLIYMLIEYEPLEYKGIKYSSFVYNIGWTISLFGIIQLPVWAIYSVWRQPGKSFYSKLCSACSPSPTWGPQDPNNLEQYQKYSSSFYAEKQKQMSLFEKFMDNILG